MNLRSAWDLRTRPRLNFLKIKFYFYMYICVSVCSDKCIQASKEGVGSPGAGITRSCRLSDVGTGI